MLIYKYFQDLRHFVLLKSVFYKAVTYFHNSQHLLEQNKYGESLANLYKAKIYLDESAKLKISNVDAGLVTAIKDFSSILNEKYTFNFITSGFDSKFQSEFR
jgi:hypothetical protein